MHLLVSYSINDDLSLGWTVTLSHTFPVGKTNFGLVSIYPMDTKPTARQLREFKREFRKDIVSESARQKSEREWEDCIIDRLGWDVE